MNVEERDLRRVLRRQSPPAGFASRVMQRIDREQRPRHKWWRAAAASVTLTIVLGAWATHEIREHQGERAKEEVLLALRIAGEKVRYAQHEVRDIGSHD